MDRFYTSLMTYFPSHFLQIQRVIIWMSSPQVLLSLFKRLRQMFQHHLKHQFLHLHQGSRTLFSLEIAPVESTDCSRGLKRMGRPRKRIYARRHKVGIPNIREDTSDQLQDPIPNAPKHTIHKFCKTHPRRRYISKFRVPRPSYPKSVHFTKRDFKKIASTPTGMRILDIGILAEVFSTLRCNECNNTLVLYEDQWKHGWQTFFRVKCQRCHSEQATFPSSRSLDIPKHHTCINVPLPPMI